MRGKYASVMFLAARGVDEMRENVTGAPFFQAMGRKLRNFPIRVYCLRTLMSS